MGDRREYMREYKRHQRAEGKEILNAEKEAERKRRWYNEGGKEKIAASKKRQQNKRRIKWQIRDGRVFVTDAKVAAGITLLELESMIRGLKEGL